MSKLKSTTLFSEVFEKADFPVAISSIDGRYLFVNKSYRKLRRLNNDYLIGKNWWDTFETRIARKTVKETYKQIKKTHSFSHKFEYEDENKKSIVINWSSKIIDLDDTGERIICEFGSDISQEVKLKSQLLHCQKVENLGVLAGGIAHEFNNILTSIIGYTSFVKNLLEENSKERNYIGKIQKAALVAAKLTSKLLGFSRKDKCTEKFINLNTLVKEVHEIIRSTFYKHISINLNLSDDIYYVLADYDQIYQSLMNLAINAKDAMKKGGTLTISTERIEFSSDEKIEKAVLPKGKYVLLTVADTGIGMDKQTKEKVFEPFFTTKEEGEGTGLGLPMVYEAIKSHKGFLFLKSKKNKGTTIEIYLPGIGSIKNLVESGDSGFFPVFDQGQSKRILIVDDDKEVLDYLEVVLIEYGYHVMRATNGQEALELYQKVEGNIDMVIIDIFMPLLDGEKVIQKIRKNDKKLKIIVATTATDDQMINKVKGHGINYLLFKPFKVSHLMVVLKKVFEHEEFMQV